MALNEYTSENIKVKLTFGNGKVYEAEQHNRDINIIEKWTKTRRENNTAGNPLGIPQSSTFTVQILDDTDNLVATNKQSPYFGYMGSNVKMEVFRMVDSEWIPYGVYYTEGWGSTIEYGHGFRTSLRGHDKLTQIGLMEIPKLPSFSSIKAIDVLKYLLEGCGLTADEYEISSSLNLDIHYFITQGSLMRDTLKELCQALLAVIIVYDTGKIVIKPAFSSTGSSLGNMDLNITQTLSVKNNDDKVYNAVRVNYNSVNVGTSVELNRLEGKTIPNGVSFIDGITVPSNTIGIDGVIVEYDIDSSEIDKIESLYYQGFQGGVTLSIVNSSSIKANVHVYGRTSNETEAYVYDSEHNEDNINKAKLLKVTNRYIQDKNVAQRYANDVLAYLKKLAQKVTIKSHIGLDANCGDTFTINSSDSAIASGTYYITSVNISSGTSYSNTIEAIKLN